MQPAVRWHSRTGDTAPEHGVLVAEALGQSALRPVMLRRNGSFGSDSTAGSRFAEQVLTVVATCRQQGRKLLDFLVAAGEARLRGTPPPSLLPAPRGA